MYHEIYHSYLPYIVNVKKEFYKSVKNASNHFYITVTIASDLLSFKKKHVQNQTKP